MNDEPIGRDPLAPAFEKAAIGILSAMAGAAFGPAGVIAAALVGPFAVHAVDRLNEMHERVYSTGLVAEEVAARLRKDGTLAHLVAEATRAAVESDLPAKRALLARAVLRALQDDAEVEVEVEQELVRAAAAVSTVDVRVLVLIHGERTLEGEVQGSGTSHDDLAKAWPGARNVIDASVATLIAAGLAFDSAVGTVEYSPHWRRTSFGERFLEALREEGFRS
jgi:hypothetical protein